MREPTRNGKVEDAYEGIQTHAFEELFKTHQKESLNQSKNTHCTSWKLWISTGTVHKFYEESHKTSIHFLGHCPVEVSGIDLLNILYLVGIQ